MKNRILLLGCNGQLGTALWNNFTLRNIDYYGLDLPDFDICVPKTYKDMIRDFKPNILINCSAYTDVYQAEHDIKNAISINALSLKYLVDICNSNQIHLIHISTDYVFSGVTDHPYIETDLPDPINIYGLSKYLGEKIIQLYSSRFSIIRTSTLYGKSIINSNNIVYKLMNIAQKSKSIYLVKDEFVSPTYAGDLANQIIICIENKITGIIHATSEGYCNWVEFGSYLFSLLDLDMQITEVNSSFFSKTFNKPQYSVLDNEVLKKNQINIMHHWKDNLKLFINNEF